MTYTLPPPSGTPGPGTESSLWDQGVEAIPLVVGLWNTFTGGDSGSHACWGGYDNYPYMEPCEDTPNYDWIMRAVQAAPDSEIRILIGYLLGANDGKGPHSRDKLAQAKCIPFWTKAVLGGKGCVASKYPEAPDWFRNFVRRYGAPTEPDFPGSGLVAAATSEKGRNVLAAAAALGALFFVPRLFGKGK